MMALLFLLTVHFVADFICQSDWMAQHKSKSLRALLAHVTVYTSVFLGVVGYAALVWSMQSGISISVLTVDVWTFAAVTFVTHLATDAVTSRITSRLWFVRSDGTIDTSKRHRFFVVIGFDQLIHAWTLGLSWLWVFGG